MIRTVAALFSAALVLTAAALAQEPQQSRQNQPSATGFTVVASPDGQQTTLDNQARMRLQKKALQQAIRARNILNACRVGIEARQRGLTELVKTNRAPQPGDRIPNPPPPQDRYQSMPPPAQHIHLILNGPAKDKHPTSAIVTARGLSARSHMQNTALYPQGSSDIRRTLQVAFSQEQDGTVSADVDLPAFTAVTSLRLDSIAYSDGSSWTPQNANACIVQPDPLMLVAGN